MIHPGDRALLLCLLAWAVFTQGAALAPSGQWACACAMAALGAWISFCGRWGA